jgi:tetratricopeptide (TPR) repeat protein
LLAALVFAAGCRCALEQENEAPEKLLEKIELSGCREVLTGPICELEDPAKLVFWVKTPAGATLEIALDGAPASVVWSPIDGGRRTKFSVSTSTRSIAVIARNKGVDRREVVIASRTRAAEVLEADKLMRAGSLDEAQAKLDALGEPTDPRARADVANLRGSIASRRGEDRAAIGFWRRSAELAEKAGVISKAINDRLSAVFMAITIRDLALARELLDEVRARSLADYAPGYVDLTYYDGMLAQHTGDFRGALRALNEAERASSRIELARTWPSIVQERANVLAALGMPEKALASLDPLVRDPEGRANPCAEAMLLNNLVWFSLTAHEAGKSLPVEVIPNASRALELYTTVCPDPIQAQNVRANLALAAVQAGAIGAARKQLNDSRKARALPPFVALWLLDIEARVLLAEKNLAAALKTYQRLAALAKRAASAEAMFRATVGRAAVLRALGRTDEAIAAYTEAEAQLDEQQRAIAIGGEARAQFLAAKSGVVETFVEVLAREGRHAEAIAVIRRARLRAVRGLQRETRIATLSQHERQRWDAAVARYKNVREDLDRLIAGAWALATNKDEHARDIRAKLEAELATLLDDALAIAEPGSASIDLAAGPLTIGYYAIGRRWLGFAWSESGTKLVELRPFDVAGSTVALGKTLLDPFQAELEKTERVQFLIDGRLAKIDFHALSFRGAPLIAARDVAYAIDLARPPRERPALRLALIVADTLGDLPAARDEASRARERLLKLGAKITELGGRQATRKTLVEALGTASFFYYCGHARFDGESGWEGGLMLADSVQLTVGDILALGSAPEDIVLSGCETAQIGELPGEQLGIAQAFVLAGADAVIAASRPIRDQVARELLEALQTRLHDPLPVALNHAQRQMIQRSPHADWAAFRAIVP